MKLVLWIIFGLSVAGFMLAISEPTVKAICALDAIIPPRVMDLTTPDERVQMSKALSGVISTSRLALLGACAMGLVSAAGLVFVHRSRPMSDDCVNARIQNPESRI